MLILLRRLLASLALIALCACPAGCLVAAAGAAAYGGYAYANGSLDGVAGATLDRTWRATLQTLEEMSIPITSKIKDGATARILAQRADNTQIEINLTRRSGDFTRVNIRIGIFGDEAESRRILNQIKAKL